MTPGQKAIAEQKAHLLEQFNALEVGKVYEFTFGPCTPYAKPWKTRTLKVLRKTKSSDWAFSVQVQTLDGQGFDHYWILPDSQCSVAAVRERVLSFKLLEG